MYLYSPLESLNGFKGVSFKDMGRVVTKYTSCPKDDNALAVKHA